MFTVPIIAPDLRHEETILQAAHALNVLQQTIESVFLTLDERITLNTAHAKDLTVRIQRAEQRIKSLVGVKKSVLIYAPARYPATHVCHQIKLTFGMNVMAEQEKSINTYETEVQSPLDNANTQTMEDKLVFFHVNTANNLTTFKTGAAPQNITAARLKVSAQGNNLQTPPRNLRSLVSLLRVNTAEEVYSNKQPTEQHAAVKLYSWRRAKLPKNQQHQQKQQTVLEPAPHSLANRNQRATPAGELRYMPKMHEAPVVDLPMDLPTLEGVAQDIHYTGFAEQLQKREKPQKLLETLKTVMQEEDVTALIDVSLSNEVVNTITTITTVQKTPEATQTKTTLPIPPPPPPPPPPTASSASILREKVERIAVATDTRSALMDAIRQAGGTRGGCLRASAAAPMDVVAAKKTAVTSGGDLMADLHNKLLMRRKGISGINSSAGSLQTESMSSSNPVLNRLSAIIPPPTAEQICMRQRQQQQHSDDDEDGNDDWE